MDPEDAQALEIFFTQLKWSDAHRPSQLRRVVIPDRPGIYLFTRSRALPTNGRNALYVGKTDGVQTSLRARLWGYCVTPIPNPLREEHSGRRLLFQYRKANKDRNLFVRWTVYSDAGGIEGALIHLLDPLFNSRLESVWADERDLDPRYIGQPYQCRPHERHLPRQANDGT